MSEIFGVTIEGMLGYRGDRRDVTAGASPATFPSWFGGTVRPVRVAAPRSVVTPQAWDKLALFMAPTARRTRLNQAPALIAASATALTACSFGA